MHVDRGLLIPLQVAGECDQLGGMGGRCATRRSEADDLLVRLHIESDHAQTEHSFSMRPYRALSCENVYDRCCVLTGRREGRLNLISRTRSELIIQKATWCRANELTTDAERTMLITEPRQGQMRASGGEGGGGGGGGSEVDGEYLRFSILAPAGFGTIQAAARAHWGAVRVCSPPSSVARSRIRAGRLTSGRRRIRAKASGVSTQAHASLPEHASSERCNAYRALHRPHTTDVARTRASDAPRKPIRSQEAHKSPRRLPTRDILEQVPVVQIPILRPGDHKLRPPEDVFFGDIALKPESRELLELLRAGVSHYDYADGVRASTCLTEDLQVFGGGTWLSRAFITVTGRAQRESTGTTERQVVCWDQSAAVLEFRANCAPLNAPYTTRSLSSGG
ncbi:hypothetical protein FGB62_486g00 [Gracilaria domingensis]|nr:hypothetical protein FGB62_486g00 [Gracilaria domingensis]